MPLLVCLLPSLLLRPHVQTVERHVKWLQELAMTSCSPGPAVTAASTREIEYLQEMMQYRVVCRILTWIMVVVMVRTLTKKQKMILWDMSCVNPYSKMTEKMTR